MYVVLSGGLGVCSNMWVFKTWEESASLSASVSYNLVLGLVCIRVHKGGAEMTTESGY